MSLQMIKCPLCIERFVGYLALNSHMDEMHYNKPNSEEKEYGDSLNGDEGKGETENNNEGEEGSESGSDIDSEKVETGESDDEYTYSDVCAILRYFRQCAE